MPIHPDMDRHRIERLHRPQPIQINRHVLLHHRARHHRNHHLAHAPRARRSGSRLPPSDQQDADRNYQQTNQANNDGFAPPGFPGRRGRLVARIPIIHFAQCRLPAQFESISVAQHISDFLLIKSLPGKIRHGN